MQKMHLGLTKTYNQFHNPNMEEISEGMTAEEVTQEQGKRSAELYKHLERTDGTCSYNEVVRDIKKLRELHVEMDAAVLAAYGWDKDSDEGPAIQLAHDFYEVDYLPENDRVRFTISPEARRQVLSRLLALNHKRHAEEVEQGLVEEDGKPTKEGKRWLEQRRGSNKEENHNGKMQKEFDISVPGDQRELF